MLLRKQLKEGLKEASEGRIKRKYWKYLKNKEITGVEALFT
jgi:5S rRNA maturation endonuclease (ribonuclease M5)